MCAIVVIRPSDQNLSLLKSELQNPTFGEYHILFTNPIEKIRLEDLAASDVRELVGNVFEVFMDYLPGEE